MKKKLPTYYISSEEKILSKEQVLHYNFHTKQELLTTGFLPSVTPVNILITSGASCPDAVVEKVIRRIAYLYHAENALEELLLTFPG